MKPQSKNPGKFSSIAPRYSEIGTHLFGRNAVKTMARDKNLPHVIAENFDLDGTLRTVLQARIAQKSRMHNRNGGNVLVVITRVDSGYTVGINWSGRSSHFDTENGEPVKAVSIDSAFTQALNQSIQGKRSVTREKLTRAEDARGHNGLTPRAFEGEDGDTDVHAFETPNLTGQKRWKPRSRAVVDNWLKGKDPNHLDL